jgi:hypothetical protein
MTVQIGRTPWPICAYDWRANVAAIRGVGLNACLQLVPFMTHKGILRRWKFTGLVALCALPVFVAPLVHFLAAAPYGSTVFLWLELPLFLAFSLALGGMVVSLVLLINRRFRPVAIRTLIAAVILSAAVLMGIQWGWHIRMTAFHRLAERSAPLIQAIRAYESQHGSPPRDLAALVPGFLPSIPGTGMAAYPEYGYFVSQDLSEKEGNPWVIIINTPRGGINFDEFMYFPLQNYPTKGYGGSLQRIRDWAYLHE